MTSHMQTTAERAGQETRGVLAGQGERGQTAGSFIKMTFPPVTDSKLQHNTPSLDAWQRTPVLFTLI